MISSPVNQVNWRAIGRHHCGIQLIYKQKWITVEEILFKYILKLGRYESSGVFSSAYSYVAPVLCNIHTQSMKQIIDKCS